MICDDQGDCNDNSDESEELCGHVESTTRECDEHNEFTCSPGICIPINDKCDGIKQCLNGKDEDSAMCQKANVNFTKILQFLKLINIFFRSHAMDFSARMEFASALMITLVMAPSIVKTAVTRIIVRLIVI